MSLACAMHRPRGDAYGCGFFRLIAARRIPSTLSTFSPLPIMEPDDASFLQTIRIFCDPSHLHRFIQSIHFKSECVYFGWSSFHVFLAFQKSRHLIRLIILIYNLTHLNALSDMTKTAKKHVKYFCTYKHVKNNTRSTSKTFLVTVSCYLHLLDIPHGKE